MSNKHFNLADQLLHSIAAYHGGDEQAPRQPTRMAMLQIIVPSPADGITQDVFFSAYIGLFFIWIFTRIWVMMNTRIIPCKIGRGNIIDNSGHAPWKTDNGVFTLEGWFPK